MACGDVLSLGDLQTAKKHQIFEAEVITGKAGGVVGGASIDYATNQVTGQAQKTLPAVLRDAGFRPASFTFETGGTLGVGDSDKAVYDPVSKTWYLWKGVLPKVVTAGANPVGDANWSPWTDPTIREDLSAIDGASLVGAALYADIRGYTGDATHMVCSGKTVAGDGAGGDVYRDDADTTTPDDGVITWRDALNRLWRRDHTPGEINLLWATGKVLPGVDYTAEFEAAARASARSTNGNPLDMRAGTILLPSCDVLLRNAFVRDPGLVLRGVSNGVSRIVGDSAITLTVHPVRGDSTPYTNTGYGGLFMYDCQLHAISDTARNSGVGLLMINCFNTQFTNLYVSGFFYNIMLRGSHFAQFRNFYAADETNSPTNPNEEIFNRGYALTIDPTPASGEIESTGLVMDGGWIHNSALDLGFGSNFTIKNMDFEPAPNTFNIGHKGHIHNNRMERMDYYAVNAIPPKYAPFPWFNVIGDGNTFEHNDIHSLGATNDPAVNPKFKVSGNENTFIFNKDGIRFGLIKLNPATSGNHVEIGKFKDLQFFAAGSESSFYVENVHIYEGFNTHKLVESRSYVESFFDFYEVQNCSSVVMSGPAEVQGLTKLGNAYTVDGSATHRIICNFNTTTKYTPGMYCLKFRLTGYSESITINIAASYLKPSSQSMPMLDMNGGYCFVRFQIVGTEDLVMPTFNINGASAGDTFTLSNVELLKFNGGRYVEADYVI